MIIHVVRHGRTASNARGLLLGRADPDLDDVGREQAMRAASLLPADSLIISSPLKRTSQTAELIASTLSEAQAEPAVVTHDKRWIELDYGDWDERPAKDVSAEEWAAWRSDADFAPPGGESLRQLSVRVNDALNQLASDLGSQDRDVVIVSHVSPIKAAVAWALGVGIEMSWRSFVAPGSVTKVAVSDRGPSLHSFNLT